MSTPALAGGRRIVGDSRSTAYLPKVAISTCLSLETLSTE